MTLRHADLMIRPGGPGVHPMKGATGRTARRPTPNRVVFGDDPSRRLMDRVGDDASGQCCRNHHLDKMLIEAIGLREKLRELVASNRDDHQIGASKAENL